MGGTMEFIFAVLMLVTPLPENDHASVFEQFRQYNSPSMRETLQQIALSMEIMDERECRWMLTHPEDYNFAEDLRMLRERYKDLKDAPSVHDSLRFPPREVINDLLSFNRAYYNHLDCAQHCHWNREWYRTAMSETTQLYYIWDTVRDSRCEYYYVTVRRAALKKLRDQLGNEAYYSGQLPPHVPLWRFREIR